MPQKIACWKTGFFSSPETDYQPVVTPPRKLAPNHFMHGQLCGVHGFVEQYDMYRPKQMRYKSNNTMSLLDDHLDHHANQEVLVAVIHLGRNLAGYPNQLHGGAAALLFDDVVGFATDELLRQQGAPQNAVTAQLHVDFLAGLPTCTTILVQVRLAVQHGRKLWFVAQMTNVPQTIVYAQAKVLFVIPRAML